MKFNVGQKVYLFNSLSAKIESDEVYGVLFVPVPVEGREQNSGMGVGERIADGQLEVREQCQLCQHQGIVDTEFLFESEDACKAWYRELFS